MISVEKHCSVLLIMLILKDDDMFEDKKIQISTHINL
jgi:hypothetical protein